MIDFLKNNWFGVAVLVVMVYFFSGFSSTVVNNIPSFGGTTNLDSLTLSGALTTATIAASGNATIAGTLGITGETTFSGALTSGTATTSTTTISVGKVCYHFTTDTGVELYGWYTTNGVWATSTEAAAACS